MSRLSYPDDRSGLGWRWQLLIFLLAALAILSRRPDALFNAQFWAEDGGVWYSQAYNLGWLHALTLPEGGYFNTLPRLAASFTLLFPLRYAPLLMNVAGLCFQALPVFVLLSSRCAGWGSLPIRALYAATYLALPNSWEINVNMTDAHFHLALVAFLIATGTPPGHWGWQIFDLLVLLLVGFTGPWEIVLCPIAIFYWWMRRYRWSVVVAAVTAVCASVQGAVLLGYAGAGQRDIPHLGATAMRFLRLLSGNVFVGALFGENTFGLRRSVPIILLVSVLGMAILFFTFLRCSLELKLFLVFAFTLFAASLSRPIIKGSTPQWVMLLSDKGARYWFFPMLASVWSLIWCASQSRVKPVGRIAQVALLLMGIGVVRDWRYDPYDDRQFQQWAHRFSLAPSGTLVEIPINPDPWKVRLVKK